MAETNDKPGRRAQSGGRFNETGAVLDRDALPRGDTAHAVDSVARPVAGTSRLLSPGTCPRACHARVPGHHDGVGNAAASSAAKKKIS